MDRATKVLLFVIALGIWAHALGWGATTSAESANADVAIQQIATTLQDIATGRCWNPKLCGR